MLFSTAELIFLNEFTDGPGPLGIDFDVPQGDSGLVEETVKTLQQKRILDADRNLKKEGVLPAKLLGMYKNAREHMTINGLFVALCAKDLVVIIAPNGEGAFSLMASEPPLLLGLLLRNSRYLRIEAVAGEQTWSPISMPHAQWESVVEKCEECFILDKYADQQPIWCKAYYVLDGQGFCYNINDETLVALGPEHMRVELITDCGIQLDSMAYRVPAKYSSR